MRILLIKTSSLGDIIHTFPALTDAVKHNPSLIVDWVAEESFCHPPLLHPAVRRVFPIALRRWRKKLWQLNTWKEIRKAIGDIRLEEYDLILDAQGLVKSGLLSLLAKGKRYGYAWKGAREPIASLFYQEKFEIPWTITSIKRTRILFAKTFGYPIPETPTDAGFSKQGEIRAKTALFLPGASWMTKKWPVDYWTELARLIGEIGFTVTIPWSTPQEHQEALRIQSAGNHVHVLAKMDLGKLAAIIQHHSLTVSVDSGLGYLSAAFQIPTFILWGPTTPNMIGQFDNYQHNLISPFWCSPCVKRDCRNKHLSEIQPPCFAEITPESVFQRLQIMVK
ncbi:lipopolysaccharide heptosyltransferase I [Candidatus Paracaedibacter symbiosus]|uniref:lipopolysaccharide heptosyltransferase I n=1 Tax=Candidatus Paracaedibacter symbiosus TaxID=244582 RepID=UPI000509A8F6|nr:lipopolysaccharide heptosyltransferase I [Candidatus Paracaedibacter symbiosus]